MSKAGLDDATPTNSVASAAPDATQVSDSAIIRNAVSAADVSALNGSELAWANSDTGSRGTITAMSEKKAAGVLCRTFTASRESFDGVGMYKGEACLSDQGAWKMQAFEPVTSPPAAQ